MYKVCVCVCVLSVYIYKVLRRDALYALYVRVRKVSYFPN